MQEKIQEIKTPQKACQEDQKLESFSQQLKESLKINEKDIKEFVNKVEVDRNIYGSMLDQYFCCICSLFAHDPVICLQCESAVSCNNCFEDWMKKKDNMPVCPVCNYQDQMPQKLMKISIQIREDIQISCFRTDCSLKKQQMKFREYIKSDHIISCLKKSVNCPQNCDQQINSEEEGIKHFQICSQGIVNCTDCTTELKRVDLKNHHQECLGLKLTCLNCVQKIDRNEMSNHLKNECEETQINCLSCESENIKRKDIIKHKQNECQEETIKCEQCDGQFPRKNQTNHQCIQSLSLNIQKLQTQVNQQSEFISLLKNNLSSQELTIKQQNDQLISQDQDIKQQNQDINQIKEQLENFEKLTKIQSENNSKLKQENDNLLFQIKEIKSKQIQIFIKINFLQKDQMSEYQSLLKQNQFQKNQSDYKMQYEQKLKFMQEEKQKNNQKFEQCPMGHGLKYQCCNNTCTGQFLGQHSKFLHLGGECSVCNSKINLEAAMNSLFDFTSGEKGLYKCQAQCIYFQMCDDCHINSQ